ncbi:MAG: extracellular solute-binding protein [Actinomycetia bacterium]|nr:extracellular solute-binding protein [Actinomycetes bacterium]
MKKSLLWVVVLVLSITMVAAFSLYGCKAEKAAPAEEEAAAPAEEEAAEEVAEEEEIVEIQLALWAAGDIPAEYQKQVDRFNSQQDKIKVDIATFSSGDAYNQALIGQIAAGVAPDVFLIDGGIQIMQFAEADAILALDELVEMQGLDITNFQESLIAGSKMDGKLFGIPKDYNTTALFYHEDLFEEAGVEPPENWDDLREAAKTLTNEDHFGFGITPQINYYLPFIESAGAHFVSEEGIDTENFVTKEHIEAIDYLLTLFTRDKSAASPQMVAAGWDGEMFGNKQVAMLFGGTWIPGSVLSQNADLKVGVTPLPVKNEEASVLYTASWVISSKSEYPEAAMELISFLTSDEELVLGYQAGIDGLPSTETGMQKLIEENQSDKFLEVYAEVVKNGTPWGWLAPTFVDKYNEMLEVLLSNPNPEEEDISKALNDLLEVLETLEI